MRLRLGIALLLLSTFAGAVNKTVKAGGGGDYTTITACKTAMSASGGDTCTVYAGDYSSEGIITLKAGTAGANHWDQTKANIVTTNAPDIVTVKGFIMASHTTLNGFLITNPSSPSSASCVEIPGNTTDFKISLNTMYACGARAMISENVNFSSTGYGWITSNTLSYSCSISSAPNVCEGLYINGDFHLIENNNISHQSDAMTLFGTHNVIRLNNFHDFTTSDCGSHSSNCHIDFIESEPVTSGGLTRPAQFNVYEANTGLNNLGANGHALLTQADSCQGNCNHVIIRYNTFAHVGTFGLINDNSGSNAVAGFSYVKTYNNDWINFIMGGGQIATTTFQHGSFGGSAINELFYYPDAQGNMSPYYVDSLGVTPSSTGFTAANNLAYLASTGNLCNRTNSTCTAGAFAADATGNIKANPIFTNYATNDFSLKATSPAVSAGTNLTTAVGSGTSSTSLTVADAAFFSDASGFSSTTVFPDWIRIGSTTTVQISSINYSTNVITLATAATWSNGDRIYLYKNSSGTVVLSSASPNIGAYQTPSTIPIPPTYTVLFSNLQLTAGNPGSWTICNANNSCSAGTPSGTGTAAITFNNASPSKSGASLLFNNTTTAGSPTGWNTLVYRHLGNSWTAQDGVNTITLASISNALLDEWVYVNPSVDGIVGYEWDPDFYVNHAWTYKASIACYTTGGGKWYVYDQSIQNWRQTNLACNWNTTGAGAWHHIRMWVTLNQIAHNYTYQTLEIDGTEIFNPSNPPVVTGASSTTFGGWSHDSGDLANIEFQADNISTAGASTENLDLMNFYIWPDNPATYTLSVTKSGTGTGTVTGSAINCGSTCTQVGIASGASITMAQGATAGSYFTAWGGTCGCTGTGSCVPTITASCTVTANFDLLPITIDAIGGKVGYGGKAIIK